MPAILLIFFVFLVVFLIPAFILYQLHCQEKIEHRPSDNNCIYLSHGYTQYQLCGPSSSPVVVFIHGGTIPMCTWDQQVKEFTEAGFRILRYDQYGRGGSERLKIPYTRHVFSEQLNDLITNLKINDPVHMLGPSFGGAISISFASKYPDKVRSIALISPVLNLPGSDSSVIKPISISSIPVAGDFIFRTIIKKQMVKRAELLITCPNCRSVFLDQFKYKRTEQSFLSAFRNDAYGSYLKECAIVNSQINRIMLVRGDKDKEVTEKMIQEIRTLLPECIYVGLKDSGHSPFINDSNSTFSKSLIQFFKNS